jgi:transcriptional regulator of arginine metabolism
MHVAKVPHKEKGYIYVLPDSVRGDHSVSTNATDNILSIAFSGNMCVITTKPGYASAISVPIDSKDIYEILGTIAGDNTILLVLREGFVMENLVNELCMIYPSIRILL